MSWSEEPVASPVRADARVVANRAETGGVRLVLEVPGWSGFAPGQFVMLSPGARGRVPRSDPLLPRPMAVYRERPAARGAAIEILYKISGRGTALLAEARPGERVALLGPLGRGFSPPAPGQACLLVGGGTGIASLYELAVRLRPGRALHVLLGARTAAELMGLDDFAALGVELRMATDDGSAGTRGPVTDLLEAALAEDPARVFACGPTPMMRRASELAAARGADCSVSLENTMACGFGVCLGCAAPLVTGDFALVCRAGPVFEASRVAWDGLP